MQQANFGRVHLETTDVLGEDHERQDCGQHFVLLFHHHLLVVGAVGESSKKVHEGIT